MNFKKINLAHFLSNFTGGTRRSTKVNYNFIILTTWIVRVPSNNYFLRINLLLRRRLQDSSSKTGPQLLQTFLPWEGSQAGRDQLVNLSMMAWWLGGMVGSTIWGTININTVKAWDRMEQLRREQEAFHDPQPSHSAGSRQVRIRCVGWCSVLFLLKSWMIIFLLFFSSFLEWSREYSEYFFAAVRYLF